MFDKSHKIILLVEQYLIITNFNLKYSVNWVFCKGLIIYIQVFLYIYFSCIRIYFRCSNRKYSGINKSIIFLPSNRSFKFYYLENLYGNNNLEVIVNPDHQRSNLWIFSTLYYLICFHFQCYSMDQVPAVIQIIIFAFNNRENKGEKT